LIPANQRAISASGINGLTSLLNQLDRCKKTKPADRDRKEVGIKLKKFGFATVVASALAAAVLGLAGPAQADIGHHDWVYDIQPHATAPHVDTSVHQSH
jgi:hypothetical protein